MNHKIYMAILLVLVVLSVVALSYLFIIKTPSVSRAEKEILTKEKNSDLAVVSFITPHHLLAKDLIEEVFYLAKEKNKDAKIDRIIILSPDHFNEISGWGFATDKNLPVKGGEIAVDGELANKMIKKGLLREGDELFQKEHGISNLLPYLEKYFPNKKVLPVILKSETPSEKVDEIISFLNKEAEGNNLIIVSSDFSHYLEKNVSEFHDKIAVDIIKSFSVEDAYNVENDFNSGIYFAMKYSGDRGMGKFELVNNSNSSKIYNKNFIGENTSYVTGYFEKGETGRKETASLFFLGDLMLDRYVRTVIQRSGTESITKNISRIFSGQDLNMLNLEGPITSNNSISLTAAPESKEHLKFTFDKKQSIDFLKYNKIDLVSLGNNHILNFGESGLGETTSTLKENNVDYIGNPSDLNNYFSQKIGDKKIAIVGFNAFGKKDTEATAKLIRELDKSNDYVFVYAHWGKEYSEDETERQQGYAHLFIDSGADVIIGSHPHVIQPIEIYKDKVIFYSLGNFVFDQYFSEATKNALGVGILLKDSEIEFYLVPMYLKKDGTLELSDEEKRTKVFNILSKKDTLAKDIKEGIMAGKFKK